MTYLLIFIFLFLSLLHLYWAAGGQWAMASSLPTNANGEKVLKPTGFDCVFVSVGLLGFAAFYALQLSILHLQLPAWLNQLAGFAIPSIFLLRSIGDFNYLGIFKRIRNTPFAKADSQIIIPLCLLITVCGYLIALL